ncbi:MAG: hypothetical protein JHC87_05095 [Thermoleophilaceae bacterium]|nr:hypothetical protein [Thermoleophilaceae bacterium]
MSDNELAQHAQMAHEILARDFTDRYLQRSGLSSFAYSVPYDPNDPLCDYETTWWKAKPNRWSLPLGKLVLGKTHALSGREIEDIFVAPFAARSKDLTRVLPDFPVALVNGHHLDLQAALALFAASVGIARENAAGRFQKSLEEMIRVAHGVATRGLAPIVVGRPKFPVKLTFLRLQQLVVNPHLSFPINKQMIESGIPREFRTSYNAKLRAQTVEAANAQTNHPKGYRTLWSMSPGGTPDVPGEGEHEGKLITKAIEPATIRLMREMGCGLLPVYTKFGKGKGPTLVELGDVVPPNEVSDSTIPTIMADLAAYRRSNGEPDVYYDEELAS